MLKKIILIIVVLAVAFLSLSEIRAGRIASAATGPAGAPSEAPGASETPVESASIGEEAVSPDLSGMDEEHQKAFIMDHYDLWSEAWDYGVDWFYAFTDLDQNGRLEVISASLQGSGLFTYADIWEIKEDFSGISKCTDNLGEGGSYPDIITESVNGFYDEATGLYYYVFDDIARSGYAELYSAKVALCLHNGTVELYTICSEYDQYESPDSDPVVTYSDGSGNSLTKEEFEQAVANWATGKTMSDFDLEWTEVRAQTG